MKYKKVLGILLIILGVLLLLITIYLSLDKEVKASIIFGNKECKKIEITPDAIEERRCKICLKKFDGSPSDKLCSTCSNELNRCCVCGRINGKKLDENGKITY